MFEAKNLMKEAVKFHGHACPGLALGVLVSKYILEKGNVFSKDEELVAVVENDNCSVDAIQSILGTTFGKGNLIHLDFGKNNYTFYNRSSKKGIKLSMKSIELGNREGTRGEMISKLLEINPEQIFEVKEVEFNPPEKAQIHQSISCDNCGEATMSTRIKKYQNKNLCMSCFEKLKCN